jgi:hypothetical protein
MKRFLILAYLAIGLLMTGDSIPAQSALPFLEGYRFEVGNSEPEELLFHDATISGGSAQFRFHLTRDALNQTDLRLEIFRPQRNAIEFALLLERIEVDLLQANGVLIRRIALDKTLGPSGLFIIGDSNDGYFVSHQSLGKLTGVRVITVKLFGNYE